MLSQIYVKIYVTKKIDKYALEVEDFNTYFSVINSSKREKFVRI